QNRCLNTGNGVPNAPPPEVEEYSMKKLLSMAVVPLFAGFLWAQATTETTTTTTTWNGTLVDAGCQTTHTEHKETTINPDATTTRTTKTEKTECPVTTTTTTFGLMTSDGQYVRFDEPSNTKVVEVIKSNKKWNQLITNREPVKVRVIGNKRG